MFVWYCNKKEKSLCLILYKKKWDTPAPTYCNKYSSFSYNKWIINNEYSIFKHVANVDGVCHQPSIPPSMVFSCWFSSLCKEKRFSYQWHDKCSIVSFLFLVEYHTNPYQTIQLAIKLHAVDLWAARSWDIGMLDTESICSSHRAVRILFLQALALTNILVPRTMFEGMLACLVVVCWWPTIESFDMFLRANILCKNTFLRTSFLEFLFATKPNHSWSTELQRTICGLEIT